MVNKAAESLMVAQVKALVLLLTLIFIIMSVMFTSFRGGAIAMVPAVIPIAMMFGVMGYLNRHSNNLVQTDQPNPGHNNRCN